ncbi:MAG: DUF3470 domain-containing protein, partial [Myxococcota bacterium]
MLSTAHAKVAAINAELAKAWKPIIARKDAPSDADEWAKVTEKSHLLEK